MTTHNTEGLRRVGRALLSVSDKTGLVEFARELRGLNVELVSTGGTAQALRDASIEVRDVSDVTGFPEMLDGRVKTLHPRIHGGLLAVRGDAAHMAALAEHSIEPIEMVVVNLYPFEETVGRAGVTLEEAVEQIDIGGPAMIRSAAKNFRDVAVVVSPEQYASVLEELRRHDGATSLASRRRWAQRAFQRTSIYDFTVYAYLSSGVVVETESAFSSVSINEMLTGDVSNEIRSIASTEHIADSVEEEVDFSDYAQWTLRKISDLRYGENPHQRAALYEIDAPGIAHAVLRSGKEMSFNNYVDADAAWQLVCDFEETTCAIIKHTNPAGVGSAPAPEEAYRRALATDPVSAFGGVVAFNRTVDEGAARAITEIFTEVVVAPGYDEAAFDVLRAKKNLRILQVWTDADSTRLDFKGIGGGILMQTRDTHRLTRDQLKVVTERAPTEDEIDALLFAWTVCKHTKSNAIVYARAGQTVGVGAGQMSRIDSVRIGAARAQLPVRGSVLASDAFFPFRDGIDEAARHGITAVIQPGGSVRDAEVVAAADEHGLAMVFTGVRHFRH